MYSLPPSTARFPSWRQRVKAVLGVSLAGYAVNNPKGLNLADYLEEVVFAGNTGVSIAPTAEDVAGFEKYIQNYKRCLPIEQSAVENK